MLHTDCKLLNILQLWRWKPSRILHHAVSQKLADIWNAPIIRVLQESSTQQRGWKHLWNISKLWDYMVQYPRKLFIIFIPATVRTWNLTLPQFSNISDSVLIHTSIMFVSAFIKSIIHDRGRFHTVIFLIILPQYVLWMHGIPYAGSIHPVETQSLCLLHICANFYLDHNCSAVNHSGYTNTEILSLT
jgi:hypothetical protein